MRGQLDFILYSRICRESAVYRNRDTCDKAGCFMIRQIEQRAEKLLGFTESPHRSCTDDLMAPVRQIAVTVEQEIFILPGDQEARCNAVDPDAGFGQVYAQPLGEIRHRGLRTAVRRNFCQRCVCVHG